MSSFESDRQTLGSIDRRYLSFEQPIGELEEQINELRRVNSDKDLNLDEDIKRLETKSRKLTETIFSALTPWQISQLARHPDGLSLWITFQHLWIVSLNSMVIECSVTITRSSRD